MSQQGKLTHDQVADAFRRQLYRLWKEKNTVQLIVEVNFQCGGISGVPVITIKDKLVHE